MGTAFSPYPERFGALRVFVHVRAQGKMMCKRRWYALFALGLMGSVSAHATEAEELATRLSALRTEVEGLEETLDLEREELRGELRALELRKTELEARIRQEETRMAELERAVERQREVLASDEVADEHLTPVLLEGIATLEQSIASGLPYRLAERQAGLEDLRQQIEAKTLDPRRAMSRVWQFVEDELRLSRENTVDRQELALPDGNRLVEVARLGMIGMFWRSDDGRYGMAERSAAGWTWREVTDADAIAQLEDLFDALKKQIRVGWFDLPWALPEVTR